MNTKPTSPECNPVTVPAGYILLTNGPTAPKNNAGTSNPIEIQFDDNRPVRPLPPLVEADYTVANTGGGLYTVNISVNAIVFINTGSAACISQNGIKIFWNNEYANPQFFIAYNAPEAVSKTFYAYEVNFGISHGTQDSNPLVPVITTFLTDEDPVTSRGTKTTVQPPTT